MRVSSIQLAIKERPKEETLQHVLALLEGARGSDLILLPEHWPCGFLSFARYESDSETLEGPTVQAIREKARDLGAFVFLGSFVERGERGLFNTSVLVDARGGIVGRYRKMHLFGHEGQERLLLRPGEDVVVLPTPWGRAGLSICYDLRFPRVVPQDDGKGAQLLPGRSPWACSRAGVMDLVQPCPSPREPGLSVLLQLCRLARRPSLRRTQPVCRSAGKGYRGSW